MKVKPHIIIAVFCVLLPLSLVSTKDTVCKESHMKESLYNRKPEYMESVFSRDEYPTTPRSILQDLRDCTVYDGNIVIKKNPLDEEFREDIRYEDLRNLQNLREIHGYVAIILDKYPAVKNLSFFSNLRKIKTTNEHGLKLHHSNVEFFGFSNIQLSVPKISLQSNFDLCYLRNLQTINSSIIITSSENKDQKKCIHEGKVCSTSCNPDKGCWGPQDCHCFECRKFKAGNNCVDSCKLPGYFEPAKGRICGSCHVECDYGCNGPEKSECFTWPKELPKSLDKIGYFFCKIDEYFSNSTKTCEKCSPNCFGNSQENRSSLMVRACSGPGKAFGHGGCNFGCSGKTFLTIVDGLLKCISCHSTCQSTCENATLSGCHSPKQMETNKNKQKTNISIQSTNIETVVIVTAFVTAVIVIVIMVGIYQCCHRRNNTNEIEKYLSRIQESALTEGACIVSEDATISRSPLLTVPGPESTQISDVIFGGNSCEEIEMKEKKGSQTRVELPEEINLKYDDRPCYDFVRVPDERST